MGRNHASLAARIDAPAMEALLARPESGPVDALNLVDFADEQSYRLYGLLVAPVLIAFGARPVWVGVHQETILGEQGADEIVIVRYPSHRLVLRTITNPFYAVVNRFREKGVRQFQFSLTKKQFGTGEIPRKGVYLVAHLNARERAAPGCLETIRGILASEKIRLVYASYEVMPVEVFRQPEPSDPRPPRYLDTAFFSITPGELSAGCVSAAQRRGLECMPSGISLHIYRGLGNREAMPWSKPAAPRICPDHMANRAPH